MPGTGNLATYALTTGAEPACITKITMPEMVIEDLETSCLSTTNYKTYVASDLAEPGEVVVEFIADNTRQQILTLGTADILTVAFGITTAGNTTKALFVADGYVSKFKLADQENGVLQTGSMTFKLNGEDVEPAYTVESA